MYYFTFSTESSLCSIQHTDTHSSYAGGICIGIYHTYLLFGYCFNFLFRHFRVTHRHRPRNTFSNNVYSRFFLFCPSSSFAKVYALSGMAREVLQRLWKIMKSNVHLLLLLKVFKVSKKRQKERYFWCVMVGNAFARAWNKDGRSWLRWAAWLI